MDKANGRDFQMYQEWLRLKLKEFVRMGYVKISEKDLWEYLTTYRWKKEQPQRYHQVVSEIMTITPNDYFNFETLKAQVYEVKSIDQLDLDGLL